MNQHLAEANHVGRPRAEVAQFFEGLELLEPGVVKVSEWRPESKLEEGGTDVPCGAASGELTAGLSESSAVRASRYGLAVVWPW